LPIDSFASKRSPERRRTILWIDLHCHILPSIDDGPKTLPEALLLARALAGRGFSHAVATLCRRN